MALSLIYIGIIFIFITLFKCHINSIKIDPINRRFVDQSSRTKIFHGVNAVYKIAPWHPKVHGYDITTTLSPTDSDNLKKWGFNIVRLGVMWPGVEPTKGEYDSSYLDAIETIVDNLAVNNIFVVLDFHQDLFHRKFCGEGVPDYVYDICKSNEPVGTKPFPLPSVNSSYPVDADGNPALDSCLSVVFGTYYLSSEVGSAFQCLYDNKENLWESLANYWVTVGKRFSNKANVVGYELINEPWAGDVYNNPKTLLPGYTEKNFLQPMYQYLHNAIRKVDDEKIIFFEGLTIDYWPNGFTESPGGSSYNDRQALAYHIYCPLNNTGVHKEFSLGKQIGCEVVDDEFFQMRTKDSKRLGTTMIMTEFGAAEDTKSDLFSLGETARLADRHQQSWMYWQFKYYEDITTCTPIGEGLFLSDGSVSYDKLSILSRTYPQSVAGLIVNYSFNLVGAIFDLTFIPLETISETDESAAVTEIYYYAGFNYETGIVVDISTSSTSSDGTTTTTTTSVTKGDFKVKCPSENLLTITQLNPLVASEVTVKISRCIDRKSCTCL